MPEDVMNFGAVTLPVKVAPERLAFPEISWWPVRYCECEWEAAAYLLDKEVPFSVNDVAETPAGKVAF